MLKKLGKYEIWREIGKGAHGVVYEGNDPAALRIVAIKAINKSSVPKSEVEEKFSRFRREAQIAGSLHHPNIVKIYTYGEEGDISYIAMERIHGSLLLNLINSGKPFTMEETTYIMGQLLNALQYSHGRGVVHRDIKPANIFLTTEGIIKIVDFGIAKIESSILTAKGFVLGSPFYMSPEQYVGNQIDGRSDLYSAGVLMYQLLTGSVPLAGKDLSETIQKVMHEMPPPPSQLKDHISVQMDEVVMKALAKYPEERFQTAAEFAQAIQLAAGPDSPPVDIAHITEIPATQVPLTQLNITQQSQQLAASFGTMTKANIKEFEKRLAELRETYNKKLN